MRGGRGPKAKGSSFEREVVQMAQATGLSAKRAWGSNGRALGLGEEVDIVLAGKAFQCKRKAKLPIWLRVPEGTQGVFFREDRGVTYALIELKMLLELMGRTNASTNTTPISSTPDSVSTT